jgi:hypothetical protein
LQFVGPFPAPTQWLQLVKKSRLKIEKIFWLDRNQAHFSTPIAKILPNLPV